MSAPPRSAAPARLSFPTAELQRVLSAIGVGGAITGSLAVAVFALALGAQGGGAIGANTTAQVLLVAAGAGLVAAALCIPSGAPPLSRVHGGGLLTGLAALTALTAVSVIWSLDPAASWLEANRTLSYLAVAAGGVSLARLAPTRWDAVLRGIGLGCVMVSAWALLTKSFPAVFAPDEIFARLRAPFDYWNATGLMAILGIPPLLWLGARRTGHGAAGALAYPGMGVLLTTLMLSYSRGALLALAIGLIVWFSAVPLRLRGMLVLLPSALTTTGVVIWAFQQPGLTENAASDAARNEAGLQLGLLLVLQAVVLLAVGLALGYLRSVRTPTERQRTLAGRSVGGVLVAALLAGLIALATAPGGVFGQVSNAYESITKVDAATPSNSPSRLTSTSSVRARYWSEAFKVQALSPVIGTGASAYANVRKRFRVGAYDVAHAHGYVPQVLADFGWVGLGVSLFALVAWAVAALRAIGMRRRDRGLPWDAERVGLTTLAVIALMFGVHSAVDWTWFIPGTTAVGLFCAAWVVGRGPLRARIETEGPSGMVRAAERVGLVPATPRLTLRQVAERWRPAPQRVSVAVVIVLAGVVTMWAIVQPLRAAHAGDVSQAQLDVGNVVLAIGTAEVATKRNPLASEPWWDLAEARRAGGDPGGAQADYERAARVQPANPETWTRLGQFHLDRGDTQASVRPFQVAYFLDPQSPIVRANLARVTRVLRSQP